MDENILEHLKYPIGRFSAPEDISQVQIAEWIAVLENIPKRIEALVGHLADEQLDDPYRPGGWTIRQVVHHLADSHCNSYVRFKWTLTEEMPTIKPYDEKGWSNLFDARSAPIYISLHLLAAIHAKLVYLLKGLTKDQLERTYRHPDSVPLFTVKETIGRYAWHSNHHYAHIQNLLVRKGWI